MSNIKVKDKFRSKSLDCGCCGSGFSTWEGYEDQDQDKGYGICKECQDDAEEQNNKLLDESVKLMIAGMKPDNAEKLKAMPLEEQRLVASAAHRNGLFTWTIGGK